MTPDINSLSYSSSGKRRWSRSGNTKKRSGSRERKRRGNFRLVFFFHCWFLLVTVCRRAEGVNNLALVQCSTSPALLLNVLWQESSVKHLCCSFPTTGLSISFSLSPSLLSLPSLYLSLSVSVSLHLSHSHWPTDHTPSHSSSVEIRHLRVIYCLSGSPCCPIGEGKLR